MCTQDELNALLSRKCCQDYQTPEVDFDTYLEKLALKRKVTVTLSKINQEMIQLWTKTHWSNLDHYSDLDEVRHTDTDDEVFAPKEEIKATVTCVHFNCIGGHRLRKRKRSYTTSRARRPFSENTFYREMCDEPKRKKSKKS